MLIKTKRNIQLLSKYLLTLATTLNEPENDLNNIIDKERYEILKHTFYICKNQYLDQIRFLKKLNTVSQIWISLTNQQTKKTSLNQFINKIQQKKNSSLISNLLIEFTKTKKHFSF